MNNRSLRQLAAPEVNYQPFCIHYLDLDTGFKLKSGLIHLLPKFHCLAGEDPYKHLKEFHVVYSAMKSHGVDEEQISKQLLIVYFYEGLLHMDRNLIDAASRGVLVDKIPDEAKALISNMAANAQQFGTRANSSAVYQMQATLTQPSAVASSTGNQRIENRLDELAIMVRQLVVTQTVQTSAPQSGNPCGICDDPFHPTDAYPSLQEGPIPADQSVSAVFPEKPQFQQQNNPFSNTYNHDWKNHPNLRWNQNQQYVLYQQNQQFNPQQRQNFQQAAPQQISSFPSQTVPNPKGTGNVSAISFRSGKQLEEPNQAAAESSKGGDTSSKKQSTDTSDIHIPLPFPHRATQSKKQSTKIPRYAKFLKELCTNKRRLKGDERVSLSQNVSALIQPMPKKGQDTGTFIIPCVIGNSVFHDCMLDLGASFNVMPESVYKSLGLGPLRATSIVVTLANRSSVRPSGVVEIY
ncbi:uncharacterized protein LOC133301611 [Gastrolobium bilobum]|uniref:uncharacterized protein LOC133301611 n=1 Tax=Gastrolobium bilobum TaxID=150636 RepID=UPI002AAFC343|nr:uncharacterized protein LOC133301611 [Gastrolobium bilobum]